MMVGAGSEEERKGERKGMQGETKGRGDRFSLLSSLLLS
jgi:hypothetical protein